MWGRAVIRKQVFVNSCIVGYLHGQVNIHKLNQGSRMYVGVFWILQLIFIVWVLHGQVEIMAKLVNHLTKSKVRTK